MIEVGLVFLWYLHLSRRNKLILILIKMCQTLAQNEVSKNIDQKDERLKHIDYFFNLKEKVKCLTRQTLFLGIAVCDRFLERIQLGGD